jgi:hypothetical protein
VTVDALLRLSRDVLRGADPTRQRAAAILARQALEQAVAAALERRQAGASAVSARAQLLCLPTYAPTEPALAARYLWWELTRACHHHPYELAPTSGEVARWLDEAERVATALAA